MESVGEDGQRFRRQRMAHLPILITEKTLCTVVRATVAQRRMAETNYIKTIDALFVAHLTHDEHSKYRRRNEKSKGRAPCST